LRGKMATKTIEGILCDFLEKHGIEGVIKMIDEDNSPIDPTFEWLCELCNNGGKHTKRVKQLEAEIAKKG